MLAKAETFGSYGVWAEYITIDLLQQVEQWMRFWQSFHR